MALQRLINKFLVGCDPEFVVYDKDGALVDIIRSGISSEVGYHDPIGYDHAGICAELHPEPSLDTRTVLLRLKRLIQTPKLQEYGKLRAGAVAKWTKVAGGLRDRNQITLGGHVHLDLDPYQENEYGGHEWAPIHSLRVKALDKFTSLLEKLDILPEQESAERRELHYGDGYGKWGDVRIAGGYPNKYRMEYRTMASWLYHPKTALLCMTGAKLCGVDPQAVLDSLGQRPEYPHLIRLFSNFSKDDNAKRISERVLGVTVRDVQFPVDVDIRETWKALI